MDALEISNVSAASALWIPGQTASLSFTVKNVSGGRFTKLMLALVVSGTSFTGGTSGELIYLHYLLGTSLMAGETVNMANNASRSFSASFLITDDVAQYFADYPSVRAVPLQLRFYAEDQNMGAVLDVPGQMILNRFYGPQITRFQLQRAANGLPDDEGENLLAGVQLSAADVSCADFLSARIHHAENARADIACPCTDLSARIPELLAGVTNSADLVPGEFSNGSEWDFLLVFGDAYESTQVRLEVGRAFANVHLSGAGTGGVCFGGFSSSREGDPRLESHYPAYLYGGVRQIGDGWTYLQPRTGSTPAEYGGGALRCRKIENRCIVAGGLQVKPGGSTIVLAQLPEGYTPANGVFSINACNGSRVARIVVGGGDEENAGKLALSWVKSLADGSNYTDSAIWVQCSIEYWVD